MKTLALYFSLVLAMVSAAGNKKLGESCTIPDPCDTTPIPRGCYFMKPHDPPRSPVRGDCLPGLLCDTVCKYDRGHACAKNADCIDDFCYKGKCSEAGANGMPCKSIKQCIRGLVCKGATCQKRTYLAVGSKCTSTVQCEYGCINEKCSNEAVNECTREAFCGGQLKCIGGRCY